MRHKTILAASAAAAAAAVIPGGTAAASTPDWLTLANVESDSPTLLPVVCGEETTGTALDPACQSLLGSGQEETADAFGSTLPAGPGGYGRSLVNVDLRDFAKWQVCGVAVASTPEAVECDNAIAAESEPVGPGDGLRLVDVDTTGSFQWSVCGVSAFGETIGSC